MQHTQQPYPVPCVGSECRVGGSSDVVQAAHGVGAAADSIAGMVLLCVRTRKCSLCECECVCVCVCERETVNAELEAAVAWCEQRMAWEQLLIQLQVW